MENRIETSHGVEVPRKSRSLDLKSLYKSKVKKDAGNNINNDNNKNNINKLKRKAISDDRDDEKNKNKKKKKKNKIVKEVSLSSLKNSGGDEKKSVDRVSHSGLGSDLHGPEESNQKSNGGAGFNLISSFDLSEEFSHIPRRKRGFVGRKKLEAKQKDEPCGTADAVDHHQIGKESFDDFKENRKSELNSGERNPEGGGVEEDDCANGDSSLKKSRTKRSKASGQKKTEPLVENSATNEDALKRPRRKWRKPKKVMPDEAEILVENSNEVCNESTGNDDDDEENLEENAAMMLSSRFDPNCTGFSSNKGNVEGLSFLLSSGRDFDDHRSKSPSESESPSVDAAGRMLRPRNRDKEKGDSRKRRHFYEVFFGDLDAIWLLNRRIKVFWPLDQIWYYGLVSEYDKERKLHHVKYDDRDEEWINLQSERFQLLLLPSEVPDKSKRKRPRIRNNTSDLRKGSSKPKLDNKEEELPTVDDTCAGSSNLDSEPIISWLARSTRRVKSSLRDVKKPKTASDPTSKKPTPPPLLGKKIDNGHHESGTVRRDKRKAPRNSNLPGRFADAMKEDSTSESISCSKDDKTPIVYVRRRLRRADQDLSSMFDDEKSTVLPVSSFARTKDGKRQDAYLESLGPGRPFSSINDAGSQKLTLCELESGSFGFHLSFPVFSVRYLYDLFETETLWLCRTVMLLRYGAVTITWPQVHMEMLFVDNVIGMRFLLFEGCLTQALAFVFLVLKMFCEPADHVRSAGLQLPVTSIRFKLTCFQHRRKQLLFAFYNYSELENTKWMYLDWKLKRHCLVSKQLPLSECTYDNIQALQNKPLLSPPGSESEHSSIKDTQRWSSQGSGFMGISGSDLVDIARFSHSDELYRKLSTLTVSVGSVPAFFRSLHLKLLMDPSLARVNFRKDRKTQLGEIASNASLLYGSSDLSTGHGDKVCTESSRPCHNDEDPNAIDTSSNFQDPETVRTFGAIRSQALAGRSAEPEKSDKHDPDSNSFPNGISVEIPANKFGRSVEEDSHDVHRPTDHSWNTNGSITFRSPNPTAPRSTINRNKHSSPFGSLSHGWSDGTGFGSGPQKPRTQVSYTLPTGGFDFSPKQKGVQRGLPTKRIRKANIKRSPEVFRVPKKNLELLSCDVNILVTASDRGWRECGAKVVLELSDHNEWRLAVKVSGETKYSYKAHQFLQPGSTNRYTHAMMWKGGKDWILEFFDRSQWALFKEMHEECHNRNVRASVKNIPIPGVRMVEEGDDNGTEIPFVRSSSKYIRQAESDIEMALDPSRVLYDMDSDDERWVQNAQTSSENLNGRSEIVSDEMFEKTICVFEKAAYAQQRDQFSSDEIEELMVGVGPMDIIKGIYEHWRQKRLKHGMPLIRNLQSPSWERYQQQMHEWELAVTKMNADGVLDKAGTIEKPLMFAFCMKPRGLEVPNKGSKQRSHKKISLSSHHSQIAFGDHYGYHNYARKSNGFAHNDERSVQLGHNYDSLDDSLLPQPSPRSMFSHRDAGLDRSRYRKLHKSRRYETAVSPSGPHSPYGSRSERGNHRWHPGFSEWPRRSLQPEPPLSQRQLIEKHFEGSDLDELRLREAAGAAKSALAAARLKRERAQRLACRADLVVHKAVAALMMADASRDCSEGSICDG